MAHHHDPTGSTITFLIRHTIIALTILAWSIFIITKLTT